MTRGLELTDIIEGRIAENQLRRMCYFLLLVADDPGIDAERSTIYSELNQIVFEGDQSYTRPDPESETMIPFPLDVLKDKLQRAAELNVLAGYIDNGQPLPGSY